MELVSGFVFGFLFGILLQKGRFCMNSAFRDMIVFEEYSLAKAVALAVITAMIGFYMLSSLGITELQGIPAHVGNIIGGFLFGVGMVLAGGCASGTLYRVGEGMVGSMIALLGFMLGCAVYAEAFPLLFEKLIKPTYLGNLTLPEALGINPWLIIIPLLVLSLVLLRR